MRVIHGFYTVQRTFTDFHTVQRIITDSTPCRGSSRISHGLTYFHSEGIFADFTRCNEFSRISHEIRAGFGYTSNGAFFFSVVQHFERVIYLFMYTENFTRYIYIFFFKDNIKKASRAKKRT